MKRSQASEKESHPGITGGILKIELSVKNKLSVITTLVVPVLQYSFRNYKMNLSKDQIYGKEKYKTANSTWCAAFTIRCR